MLMTCKLEQALETVGALIKKLGKHNSLLDLQRIEFEIKAKMNAKSRMLEAATQKLESEPKVSSDSSVITTEVVPAETNYVNAINLDKGYNSDFNVISVERKGKFKIFNLEGWKFPLAIDTTTDKNTKGTWEIPGSAEFEMEYDTKEKVTADGDGFKKTKIDGYTRGEKLPIEVYAKDASEFTKDISYVKDAKFLLTYDPNTEKWTLTEPTTSMGIGITAYNRAELKSKLLEEANKPDSKFKKLKEAINYSKNKVDKGELPGGYNDTVNNATVVVDSNLKHNTKVWPNQVNVLRQYNTDKHYGNPFGTVDYGKNATVHTKEKDEEVTKYYTDWLLNKDYTIETIDGKKINLASVESNRRDWIREQILSGALDGKELMYFRDTGKTNHAKALAVLINDKAVLKENSKEVSTTIDNTASDFLDAQQDFVDEQYAIGGSKEYIEMIDAIQNRINEGRKLIEEGKPTTEFIAEFKKDLKTVSDKRKELLAKFFDVDIPKINNTELISNGTEIEGLKPQQAEAAVKLQNMLNSKVDNTFILEGEAGTGKSYTVSRVLAKYIEKHKGNVVTVAAATAHKAKDVIGDMIDEVLQEVGKNDIIELEPVTRVVDLKLPSMLMDVKDTKVVVLDEVSMVSPSTMADIKHALEFARSKGVNHKVIMLGDRAQLRPVVSGLSVTDKDRVAFKDNKSGFYIFKKDMYDFGLPGTYDSKKGLFIPNDRYREDAILPAKLNTDGSITIDAGSMLLKSFIFRSLDDVPESLRHKLDEQQRNKTKTFEAIRKFRTDVVETELAAENSKSYREQFTNAVNGLTAVGAVRLDSKTSIPTKVMNDIKHGRGVFLSYINAKVDSANTLFTNIFAKESGVKENIDTASKYGVFAGQRVFSVSNITIGTTRITNNTQGTVDSIEDIGNVNSSFVLYDTDKAYRLAKEKFPHMWNFGSMYKTIDPSVTVALNTTAMVSDGVNILTAIGINIRNKDGGNSHLIDIMLNGTSKKAIVDYVNSNAAKFSMYDKFINKNETAYNRALSKFFIKYGTVKIEVVTKDTHEVEIASLDNVLVKTYNGVQQTSYAKDIVNNFMGIAAPYAQTVHKSQGSTFDSIISDEYTNSYQTMVNKMELLYVALSRSRGDIVLAPDILNNLAKTEFNIVSEEIDGYLNSTGEVDTKPEDSIINTEKEVTESNRLLDDMIECKNSGGF